MGKIEFTLAAVNQRLKDSRVKVRLKQRGETISLVATLPPKPGDDRPHAYQQTIALGIPASEIGLRRAEDEARRMGAALALGQFDWSFYLDAADPKQFASYQLQRFKAHYIRTHTLTERTWEKHWAVVFKELPPQSLLEPEILLNLVDATNTDLKSKCDR